MRRRLAAIALCAGCSLYLAGCSLYKVKPPPDYPTGAPPECTESYVPPIVDTAISALALSAAIAVEQRTCPDGACEINTHAIAGTAAVVAIVTGFSAVSGFTDVRRCRKLMGT